jgi:hypothetical protein
VSTTAQRRQRLKGKIASGTYVPRVARDSKDTSSCVRTSAPRLFVEAYADHSEGDAEPATARYIRSDKLEDASIGHATAFGNERHPT